MHWSVKVLLKREHSIESFIPTGIVHCTITHNQEWWSRKKPMKEMQPINKIKSRGKTSRLTTISAMTRGCLNGLRRKARPRVRATTRHICKIARGSAKSRGLSPWKTPLDVAFIGAGHFGTVEFNAIFSQRNNDPGRNTNLQSSRFGAWIMWTSVRLREKKQE